MNPWAYIGTDKNVPKNYQFPISPNNAWAAVAVWISMTVNPDMLTDPNFDSQTFADAMGITKISVDSIRAMASADQPTADAFVKVATTFGNIGHLKQPYPPSECMTFEELVDRMQWVKDIQPLPGQ
jgi:hypothetical protein